MFLLTCLMTFGHDYRLLFKSDLTSGIQRRLGILCFPKTLVNNPSVGSVFSNDHGLVAS